MPPSPRFLAFAWAMALSWQLWLAPAASFAQATDSPVDISADRLIHEKKKEKARAEGSVVITHQEKKLTGDKAIYDLAVGKVEIAGNVAFTDKKSSIYCDRALLDPKTGFGHLEGARGDFRRNFFFQSDKVERTATDHYLMSDVRVTTCAQEDPHWSFSASKADLIVHDRAWLDHVVFRAGDIPLFYLPMAYVPVDNTRKTGFLFPIVGYSDLRGSEVVNAFFWAIAENADATIAHRYYGDIGNQIDLEGRYILDHGTWGEWRGSYLFESDPSGEEGATGELWTLDIDHHHRLPWGINNITRIEKESQESLDRKYGDDINNRTRRYADSHTTFSKGWEGRNLTLSIRERETVGTRNGETLRSLPALEFVNPKESLLGHWLYGSLNASFINYDLTREEEETGYEVTRFSAEPTVTLPLSIAPWLAVTAEAGYRIALYSHQQDENGDPVAQENSIFYPSSRVTLTGPKFFRVFDTGDPVRPRIKHLITPTIAWRYIAGHEEEEDSPYRVKVIDALDVFTPRNQLIYALTNELLTKEVVSPQSSRTVQSMRFTLSQTYDLDAAADEANGAEARPYGPILVDLDTRLLRWLLFNVRAHYNLYDEIWSSIHTEVGFRLGDTLHFAIDRRFAAGVGEGVDDIVWDTAYAELNLGGGISLDYSIIYNEIEGTIHDSLFRTRFTEDCWSIALNVAQRTVIVTNDDGIEETGQDFSAIISISLRGLGYLFGGEWSPLAGRKL